MATIETRLRRVEAEVGFRHWLQMARRMEAMSVEELDRFTATGQWPAGAGTLDKPVRLDGSGKLDQALERGSGDVCRPQF